MISGNHAPPLVCVAISSIALRMLTVARRGFQHFFLDIRATKLGNDNCLRALQQEKWNFKAENTFVAVPLFARKTKNLQHGIRRTPPDDILYPRPVQSSPESFSFIRFIDTSLSPKWQLGAIIVFDKKVRLRRDFPIIDKIASETHVTWQCRSFRAPVGSLKIGERSVVNWSSSGGMRDIW